MIDPTRLELLRLIKELSAECPEYRFGQLVLNLAFLAREDGDSLAWNLEDAEFVDAARKHLADWRATHDIPADPSQAPMAQA
jgi:hypothetical protein